MLGDLQKCVHIITVTFPNSNLKIINHMYTVRVTLYQ